MNAGGRSTVPLPGVGIGERGNAVAVLSMPRIGDDKCPVAPCPGASRGAVEYGRKTVEVVGAR